MLEELEHTVNVDTLIPHDWPHKTLVQKVMWLMHEANKQGHLNIGDIIGIGSRRSFDDPPRDMFEEYIDIESKKRVKRRQDLEAQGIYTSIGGV